MPFWRRDDNPLPKTDRGSGSFDNYKFDLIPNNKDVKIRLAGSDPYQQELETIASAGEDEITTAMSRRSSQQEGVDAPIEVRLFTGRRVSGVVGTVPRGLESIVDEALSRLENRGDKARIPVAVVKTKNGYRVDLLMGRTR
ncbi:hypothetical protein CLV46_2129 [Diaminobutyricimonas aerilata]|uniref:Uncharacterized protein n=1 Tax=Diaminobutyricimonas aerilata TaxID=1162967 RepID=A0A2M9CKZ6_9MICO|nr:hypothetical protein [Diaminobutyricimonas aerilata]PJJ72557.1 hypothetical protein CLV46_2129 [Diaminobutyricimonas aerilata]